MPASKSSALLLSILLTLASGPAGAADKAKLPLSRVVVFNTGVAFFEHAGTVNGSQTAALEFESRDVNDVLKSLVLLDLDGGKTSTVTYDNREPLARTLGSLSVDLSQNVTLADLLRQLRGQQIAVQEEFQKKGRIVGVERRQTPIRDTAIERDFLLLRTNDGLTTIALDKIRTLRLLDESLDADFQRALELLATARSSQSKRVTLSFLGEGKRRVRAGYIREAPVWKTSYRLVLDEEKKPLLQGWAIVENTTTSDWKNVDLSLVSGRPITFVMDLYEPLYVHRPKVTPDVFAGLNPRVYDQDLAGELALEEPSSASELEAAPLMPNRSGRSRGFGGGGFGGGGGSFGSIDGRPTGSIMSGRGLRKSLEKSQEINTSAGDVGELFRYHIDVPVTLESERSAMLAIVSERVKGEKVAIYNPDVHPKHPLSGLRLTNSTDLHLMQGPITVFDGGEFAGDARIGDIPPNEERLISYALDLETEIVTRPIASKHALVAAKLNGLALVLKHRHTRGTQYLVKNSDDKKRQVLVERPMDDAWKLAEPKQAAETTRDLRRFLVEVAPSKSAKLVVREQHESESVTPLSNMSDRQIAGYLETPGVPAEVRKVLTVLADRRKALSAVEKTLTAAEKQVATIWSEQQRIRKNMQGLERTSSLYRRYEKKLDSQETEIETLRKKIEQYRAEVQEMRKNLLKEL